MASELRRGSVFWADEGWDGGFLFLALRVGGRSGRRDAVELLVLDGPMLVGQTLRWKLSDARIKRRKDVV